MNMVDVICLAVHLYSLVGKQCTSGISEDMRFQVFILNTQNSVFLMFSLSPECIGRISIKRG